VSPFAGIMVVRNLFLLTSPCPNNPKKKEKEKGKERNCHCKYNDACIKSKVASLSPAPVHTSPTLMTLILILTIILTIVTLDPVAL